LLESFPMKILTITGAKNIFFPKYGTITVSFRLYYYVFWYTEYEKTATLVFG